MASDSARIFSDPEEAANPNKENLLFDAIEKNDLETTAMLLGKGTNPNVKNGRGLSPLMIATRQNNVELVQCLLRHNADVNLWIECGGPVLMAAASAHSVVIFELLLNAGVDVNEQDINDDTVLMHVIHNDNEDLTRALLQTGKCKLDLRNMMGQTAMHLAVHLDKVNMVKILLAAGANPDVLGPDGYSPLMCAHSREAADVLLAAGADPSHTDKDGVPCLHYAIQRQVPEVTSRLIQAGADVNVSYENGRRPLFWALICWASSTVEELIRHGADVTARDQKNRGAIYFAATRPDPFICRYLISEGADPHDVATDGTTPLYIAVSRGHTAVAKVLLEHHVKLNNLYPYDGKSVTVLDIAIAEHLEELSNMLYELGCEKTEHYSLSQDWPAGVLTVLKKMREPRRLLDSCRIVTWSYFGKRLSDYLENVPIPQAVKDCVLMKDLLSL